jgi:hypothetical protein
MRTSVFVGAAILVAVSASTPARTQEQRRPTADEPADVSALQEDYTGMCYRFMPENTALPFLIWRFDDQFGRRELRIARHPTIVCVPATIRHLGPYPAALLAEPVGLLACFPGSIDNIIVDKRVRVRSQFGTDRGTLHRATMFCMPSRKAGSLISYMCYDFIRLYASRFARARVADLFGRREVVVRAPPDLACVRVRIVQVAEPSAGASEVPGRYQMDARAPLQPPVQLSYTSSLDPVGVVGERLRFRTRFGLHTGEIGLPLGPFVRSSIPEAE